MPEFVPAPATLPPSQRVYAVGDTHGCLEQLTDLHALIFQDLNDRPVDQCSLIHLGDYVDRGPDCAQLIGVLAAGPPVPGVETINLMGNHEDMMLTALTSERPEDARQWLSNGGADSLLSWGISRTVPPKEWAVRIPADHLAFLRDLPLSYRVGPYWFVHAGVRPGIPLDKQEREDMLWIREPFLSSKKDLGAVVVHGHTPTREPVVRPNRVGIDTGAVMGGMLTCVVLEGDQLAFLQA
jgi:serine/threonine protein phosphatase 1